MSDLLEQFRLTLQHDFIDERGRIKIDDPVVVSYTVPRYEAHLHPVPKTEIIKQLIKVLEESIAKQDGMIACESKDEM